jgi:hypothetical protein
LLVLRSAYGFASLCEALFGGSDRPAFGGLHWEGECGEIGGIAAPQWLLKSWVNRGMVKVMKANGLPSSWIENQVPAVAAAFCRDSYHQEADGD